MKTIFPEVNDFRTEIKGYETLFSNEKAKKLLNWEPVHHWRNYVSVPVQK
ncbi:hypothetical protein [Metabacillus herbersteinensis]